MEPSQPLNYDCWELVINLLNTVADQHHFGPVSLVSKQLLSVTNQLTQTLRVFDHTAVDLPNYMRRFPRLKMIDFSKFLEDVTPILHDLAHSDLSLEGLDLSNQKVLPLGGLREIASREVNFRILKCSKLSMLTDTEIFSIGSLFPLLEELDISYPAFASAVSDDSIDFLSRKLPKLAKINLAGNVSISDQALISLGLNCGNLKEVVLQYCGGITQEGVAFLVNHNPFLVSISLGMIEGVLYSTFSVSFAGLTFLTTLELFYISILDQFLFTIPDAKLPLKRFALCHCKQFSATGLLYFLHAYSTLESICLAEVDFLNDMYLVPCSRLFTKMISISLNCCPLLTNNSFYALLEACPLLEKLEMANTGLGRASVGVRLNQEQADAERWKKNMEKVASLCPKLNYLDVSGCEFVGRSIVYILESCKMIRHLKANLCPNLEILENTPRFEKLEILEVMDSSMSDLSLTMFAQRSPLLRRLNMRFCCEISADGVKAVLQACPNLREIDTTGCVIEPRFVEEMVVHQPLLRHIVLSDDQLYARQQNLFLRVNCRFCCASP